MPALFELWEFFRDCEYPVQQAGALVEFSNRLTHLRWAYEEANQDSA